MNKVFILLPLFAHGCDVTTSDDADTGIDNSPPVLDSVTLSLAAPVEDNVLTCSPGAATDADGDTVAFETAWTVDGSTVLGVKTDRLISAYFDKNQGVKQAGKKGLGRATFSEVMCTVTPTDGVDDGLPVDSNTVTIGSGRSHMSLSSADAKLTGMTEEVSAGNSLSTAGDVNNDGYDDVLVGAFGAKYSKGKIYLILGSSSGLSDMSLLRADAQLTGENMYDHAGKSVSTAGDVNNDGYDDVLVGAFMDDSAGNRAGAAYLILGSSSGFSDMNLSGADAKLTGEGSYDTAGHSVSTAGDVNDDGYDDVLVGAPKIGWPEVSGSGAAYLILGSSTGLSDMSLASADARLIGEHRGDAGHSVSTAGDVNSDGYSDILVGAHLHQCWTSPGGASCGAAYLILGSSSGFSDMNLSGADAKLTGEGSYDTAGHSVSTAGDVNDDGYDDVLVGAPKIGWPELSGSGAAYLILGSSTGLSDMSLASADAKLTGERAGDQAGYSVSTAGDVNNDGYADVLVGAPGNNYNRWLYRTAGSAYLILGSNSGFSDMSLAGADIQLTGEGTWDFAGYSVSTAGDVNNDGYSDILVGAYGDDTHGSKTGAAYLVFGWALK